MLRTRIVCGIIFLQMLPKVDMYTKTFGFTINCTYHVQMHFSNFLAFEKVLEKMTYYTIAIGKKNKDSPYEKITIQRGSTSEEDIDIDIKYCGFCHTDVHLAYNHWGFSNYPNVPGHEIAGIVTKVMLFVFQQILI